MSGEPTLYRDRETGEVVAERVFGGDTLHFLYEHPLGRLLTDTLLVRRWFNVLYGWLQRRPRTRREVPSFVEELGIDPDEATRPLEDYRSLDDFFTRRLRPEARPIDQTPGHLVSPCDARVLAFPQLDGAHLQVKDSATTLGELLGDEAAAERYRGGAVAVLRLAPADYHWFHFPASGEASPSRTLPGLLHSVHPIALGAGAASFRNHREVSTLRTDDFGELLLVEVGALVVGTIVQEYEPGPVERGEAKGYFRFGGSTVIVAAQPGRLVFDEDLVETTGEGLETRVKMGTRIGRAP